MICFLSTFIRAYVHTDTQTTYQHMCWSIITPKCPPPLRCWGLIASLSTTSDRLKKFFRTLVVQMNTLQNNEMQGISEQNQDEYSIMIDEKGKKCWWRFKMSGNGKPLSPLHLFTLFFSLFYFHLDTSSPPISPCPESHWLTIFLRAHLCVVEKTKYIHGYHNN